MQNFERYDLVQVKKSCELYNRGTHYFLVVRANNENLWLRDIIGKVHRIPREDVKLNTRVSWNTLAGGPRYKEVCKTYCVDHIKISKRKFEQGVEPEAAEFVAWLNASGIFSEVTEVTPSETPSNSKEQDDELLKYIASLKQHIGILEQKLSAVEFKVDALYNELVG